MHLQTLLVIPCLYAGAIAETYQIQGSFSKFKANSSVESTKVTESVYEGCEELGSDGKTVVSKGSVCVSNLLKLSLMALTAAPGEEEEMVLLVKNNTVTDTQFTAGTSFATAAATSTTADSSQPSASDSYGISLKREEGSTSEVFLKRMNGRLSQQSQGDHTVRAVQVGRSDLHPKDGIAVRTNVQSDDAVLHVHTNGSHATAAFTGIPSSQMDRRDEGTTQNHRYRFFGEVKGIKMQLQWAEDKQGCDVSSSDLSIFASAFGFGDGKNQPAFKKSDSWKYAVCKDKAKLFQGKLISEKHDTDLGYEGGDDTVDCV